LEKSHHLILLPPYITKMARHARKQMADMRAMEHQTERRNIIDPRQVSTEELFDEGQLADELPAAEEMAGGRFYGSGATPTMGLSTVRGGKHSLMDHLKHPMKGYGKHNEAYEMGKHLRGYLTKLHGHGYAEAFAGGCGCSGGAKDPECEYSKSECHTMDGTYVDGECYVNGKSTEKPECGLPKEAKPFVDGVQYFVGDLVTYNGDKYECIKTTPKENHATPESSKLNWKLLLSGKRAHKGKMSGKGRMVGGSGNLQKSGSYEGLGRRGGCGEPAPYAGGKKKRAPAAAGDGRRARAEIVKRVMGEKGLSMIEASKYVKAHDLY
jgi:hypothetical protein